MSRATDEARRGRAVVVERRVAAPPDIVFAYFTDPERYRLWQGVEAELDPRPGGLFRVTISEAGPVARGEFLEVDPPSRLVFTWGWEGVDSLLPGESTVEVVLRADGDGTLLRLLHSGLPTEEACQLHSYGWGVGLDNLVVVAARSDLA